MTPGAGRMVIIRCLVTLFCSLSLSLLPRYGCVVTNQAYVLVTYLSNFSLGNYTGTGCGRLWEHWCRGWEWVWYIPSACPLKNDKIYPIYTSSSRRVGLALGDLHGLGDVGSNPAYVS
ncbi:hypothetical protein K439DRAFT_59267 [Ramaria rubella]|nr:hypothetical protein K439DRAFT_59267 [Ramaria rubella]